MLSRRLGWLGWLTSALVATSHAPSFALASPRKGQAHASRIAEAESVPSSAKNAAGSRDRRARPAEAANSDGPITHPSALDAPAERRPQAEPRDAKAEPRDAKAEPKIRAKTDTKAEPRPSASSEAKAEPRSSTTSEAELRSDASSKAEARTSTAIDPAVDAKAQAKHKKVATIAAPDPSRIDPKELPALTGDPVLGKADRIDGYERKGVVAFTFDDGPNPETTPQVIDALQKYDIPATFFIVTQRISGKHGEAGRALLHRQLEAGFIVGSHSMSHKNLKRLAAPQLTHEIDAAVKQLAVEAAQPIGMFRAPYGSLNAAGRSRLKKLGLTETHWSVDTLDWKAHDADKLRKKVVSMIKADGGGVVLMHDVKPITAQVIAGVLDDLEAENCMRLTAQREPILPVSLHYFLTDGKKPRALPSAVEQRTAAYKAALPERCAKRPPPPPVEDKASKADVAHKASKVDADKSSKPASASRADKATKPDAADKATKPAAKKAGASSPVEPMPPELPAETPSAGASSSKPSRPTKTSSR